ncbi:MAG: preprotein translocase subunit SecG [Qingshengfaniella sp.]
MENVILIVHLILALCLIGVVLLQRSEGGGLGMGGGGAMTGRPATTALGKLTWTFAGAFICTSVALTIIAAENSAGSSVFDRLGINAPVAPATPSEQPLGGGSLLPPSTGNSGSPALPPRAE